jgi:TPP-dependent pyruvate/acetoin dehydrogenase alpha subunit
MNTSGFHKNHAHLSRTRLFTSDSTSRAEKLHLGILMQNEMNDMLVDHLTVVALASQMKKGNSSCCSTQGPTLIESLTMPMRKATIAHYCRVS